MGEQVVVVGVKQRGFVVVAQVFEQEVIAALDDAKVEVIGCLDDIAICNGEVVDGVGAWRAQRCQRHPHRSGCRRLSLDSGSC